jgi:thiol-disulfide isomerase/thioredoxin
VSLDSLRGSWVLLHFTATWCPFCDAEVEHLGEVADAFEGRGVRVLVVDVKEDAARWRDYAAARVADSVVPLYDADGAAAVRFAPPRAQPSFQDRTQVMFDTTLIVDPAGRIRLFLFPDSAHFDPTFRAVREELDRLLKESGQGEPAVLRPEAVATIGVSEPDVAPGGDAEVAVTLDIAAGYHVMSNRPSEPSYIATVVSFDSAEGVSAGEAAYPAASTFHFDGRAITTFRGTTRIDVPVRVDASAKPGAHVLGGHVRYQACTATGCLFPITRTLETKVHVRAGG